MHEYDYSADAHDYALKLAQRDNAPAPAEHYATLLVALAARYRRRVSHLYNTTTAACTQLHQRDVHDTVYNVLTALLTAYPPEHDAGVHAYSEMLCLYTYMRGDGTAAEDAIDTLRRHMDSRVERRA